MKTCSASISLLIAAVLSAVMSANALPAIACPISNEPLSIAMTLASRKNIVLGQPIVLRYSLENSSASASIHFDLGQNKTAWYHLFLVDAKGKSAQIIPDLRPTIRSQWGLYQTGDKVLSPGDSLQGSIVVTHYFNVTHPGKYLLTVHVPLNYTVDSKETSSSQDAALLTHLQIVQSFTCLIEVEAVNPAELQATAESLRRKLTDLEAPAADQWEPVTEELFSMPEAQVLSSWQALINDPSTPDGVRVEAANQLAYHPSHAAADLLTQMLWNTPLTLGGNPSLTELSRSEIARALVAMEDVASPDIKQQIRLLYSQHQGQTPDVRRPSAR